MERLFFTFCSDEIFFFSDEKVDMKVYIFGGYILGHSVFISRQEMHALIFFQTLLARSIVHILGSHIK